jgi:hypothetical protein
MRKEVDTRDETVALNKAEPTAISDAPHANSRDLPPRP